MAQADWTEMLNVLNSSAVKRGVTAGKTPPNGGGTFVFGMASKTNATGGVALYTNLNNFSPMSKGGVISGALLKAGGGGASNHAPFLFIGAQSNDINGQGYILGIGRDDPGHLVLRKGTLITGVPDAPDGSMGVLARSTRTVDVGEWVHLMLEMVVNTNGDVVLNVYENNLSANSVASPVWEAVDGMKDTPGGIAATAFIDDALGVNSGSAPFTAGRAGFGGFFADVARAVYFDHITLARQT